MREIRYRFELRDGTTHEFVVDIDRAPVDLPLDAARWTALERNQCSNCPLDRSQTNHCPTAVDLEKIVVDLRDLVSHDDVKIAVETPARTIYKTTDIQSGLGSLLGLVMATSACPILSKMRGMAELHLPFQSLEETLFRFLGAYCVGQALGRQKGLEPDWEFNALRDFLDDLMTVNKALKQRLKAASPNDATINAISDLATGALNVQMTLDDSYESLIRYTVCAEQG